jgi:hypothetical protein
MISSARTSSIVGISRPSVLAVRKLITRSNLVGCTIGNSPAFFVPTRRGWAVYQPPRLKHHRAALAVCGVLCVRWQALVRSADVGVAAVRASPSNSKSPFSACSIARDERGAGGPSISTHLGSATGRGENFCVPKIVIFRQKYALCRLSKASCDGVKHQSWSIIICKSLVVANAIMTAGRHRPSGRAATARNWAIEMRVRRRSKIPWETMECYQCLTLR